MMINFPIRSEAIFFWLILICYQEHRAFISLTQSTKGKTFFFCVAHSQTSWQGKGECVDDTPDFCLAFRVQRELQVGSCECCDSSVFYFDKTMANQSYYSWSVELFPITSLLKPISKSTRYLYVKIGLRAYSKWLALNEKICVGR